MKKKHFAKTSYLIVISVTMFLFAMAGPISAASLPYSINDLEDEVDLDEAYGTASGPRAFITRDGEPGRPLSTYYFYPYGDDFRVDAFCINPVSLDKDNPGYTLTLVPEETRMEQAAKIASNYFFNDAFDYSRKATQLAIWEIMYETDLDDLNIFSGFYQLNEDEYSEDDYTALGNDVNDILLTSYGWAGGVAWARSFGTDNPDIDANQDLLVPVPEPALVLFIALGLIGLVGIGRRKFMMP